MDDAKFIERLNFYPRSPRGERLQKAMKKREKRTISIHAPREGSDVDDYQFVRLWNISIHAPREGSDHLFLGDVLGGQKISIHAPREGSDTGCGNEYVRRPEFLSTLPARGATAESRRPLVAGGHFYPRSPRGERP